MEPTLAGRSRAPRRGSFGALGRRNHIPMRELINRIAQASNARVEAGASSWTVRVPKRSDLVFEVVVPHDVLEWFISIRDPAGRELWSDWMDYAGYIPSAVEDRSALALEMERDIEWFVSTPIAAEDVRITRGRLMLVWRRSGAEWCIDGRWQPVSMTDPRRSPA
jgi:hypothetical protein